MSLGAPAPVPTNTASKPFFEQILDPERPPDDHVGDDLHAQRLDVADLAVQDVARQPELGDAVAQHAAGLVQGLEDRDRVALLGEVARDG